jgi:hypothetical protein
MLAVVCAPWLTTPTGADGAVEEGTGSAGIRTAGRPTTGPFGLFSEFTVDVAAFVSPAAVEETVSTSGPAVGL